MRKLVVFGCLILVFCGFNITSSAQTVESPTYVNGLVVDNATGMKRPVPYAPLREADIMWKKRIWREIDFRQKMNQGFYYPITAHENWRNFITVVCEALEEGKLAAYEYEETDEFLNEISFDQFVAKQSDTSYKTLRRAVPPYDEYDTVIITRFEPSQVMRLRIKEDWYFDKQRSQLLVKIVAICPVMMKELESGDKAPQPLFWIPYESAREVFAQAPFFNRSNSAAQLSYDEVFCNRIFDSYIYKEENTYDRPIQSYATGIDALLESDRIKQNLMDFEQSLWQY